MGLTFGRITRAFINEMPLKRIFNFGGEELVAKTGITSKGMKYTKLYSKDGDLISWKHSQNGRIRKGRYEKVDMFDRNKGLQVDIQGNKKLTTVRFDGYEEIPQKKSKMFADDQFDPLNKYDPLNPNYSSYNDDSLGFNNDPLANPWEKSPWDI